MDVALLLKFVFAFTFVMGLMFLCSWAVRRAGLAGSAVPGAVRRRLKVVEYLSLDQRRRLVLVRRDDREHLLVLGPQGETVVETGIAVADGKVVEFVKEQKNVQA